MGVAEQASEQTLACRREKAAPTEPFKPVCDLFFLWRRRNQLSTLSALVGDDVAAPEPRNPQQTLEVRPGEFSVSPTDDPFTGALNRASQRENNCDKMGC